MARKPLGCTCEVSGYVTERTRGPDGKFKKTTITPLYRITDCPTHQKAKK